jgi:hypothetical protein
MKTKHLFYFSFLVLLLISCKSEGSKHPYKNFFYEYNEDAKFYQFRDVIHGMNEKFFRVFGIDDSYGKHIVVESFTSDGRITEAYNYNLDSLTIIDHMIVNRDGLKTKAQLIKNRLIPFTKEDQTWFASKFPGFIDSTVFLSEIKRTFYKSTPIKTKVMGESKNTIVFTDTLKLTMLNPFKKTENTQKAVFRSYFAEGVGLVRIHDVNMKTDYRLEKILTQKEWVTMMRKMMNK